jgi:putative selenate reductase
MRPLPFGELLSMGLGEYEARGSIFGIRKDKFYTNKSGKGVNLFGVNLGSPVGPAAGPHTQLAQNIAAAYLAGGRFFELKTVQTMDGEALRKAIARPCINASDECYNVEWSTELRVEEAFAEYVKSWFLVHVLGKEFNLTANHTNHTNEKQCDDCAFNMSVGYSFEGITSPKIDGFIEGLKDASGTDVWKECYGWLEGHLGLFTKFVRSDLEAISPHVANSVTLSTLHGCPAGEIEKIASYLIEKKQIHTYVKCNPTLLGYKDARKLLDGQGFGYVSFDEHHFNEDLQYNDAVAMFKRLMALAKEHNVQFGVKLTNTFPVNILRGELPGEEMYMSGKALFPLTMAVADKLRTEFGGSLPISYSGGADFFNLGYILGKGIKPVTVATTMLKPGGYGRLKQLAECAEEELATNDTKKHEKIQIPFRVLS